MPHAAPPLLIPPTLPGAWARVSLIACSINEPESFSYASAFGVSFLLNNPDVNSICTLTTTPRVEGRRDLLAEAYTGGEGSKSSCSMPSRVTGMG